MLCVLDCSVPRYKLLLEQLLKFTASPHPDLALLTAALTQIGVTASHINEAVRRREAMDAMVAIEERFMSSPGFVHASRVFIRQGALTKVGKSGAAKQEHFFLFNDLLASARSVMGRYVLKKKVMIDSHFCLGSQHATQHAANAPPTRFGLLVLYRDGGCISLYFQSTADKEAWLADIEKCIAQAANTIQAADRDKGDRDRDQQQSGDGTGPQPHDDSGVTISSRAQKNRIDMDEEQKESGSQSADRQCAMCSCAFTLFNRRHNCRQCGRAVCGDCSRSRLILHAEERRPERVCDGCALSAESPRPAITAGAASATSNSNSSSNSSSSPILNQPPSSPSSSSQSIRSISSRGSGHHYSPSTSFNLPATLADVPEHSQQSAAAIPDQSTLSIVKRAPAHSRAASSSAALIAALSEPAGPYPPMAQWDCATLLRWLCEAEIGFEQFVEGFAKFHVDGPALLELTDDELRDEIGMKEQLHRKRLRKLIERLANGPALPAAPQPPPPPPISPRTPGVASTLTADQIPKGIWKASYQPASSPVSVSVAASCSAPQLPDALSLSSRSYESVAYEPISLNASSPLQSTTAPVCIGSASAVDNDTVSTNSSFTGSPTPAMPKRAAPSLPQRQRNTAVSGRWATPSGVAESRVSGSGCGKCGRVSDTAGLKFCSTCGTFVSESGRTSVDAEQLQQDREPSISSTSRRPSGSTVTDSKGASGCGSAASRVSSSIAQRAAMFEQVRSDT